MCRKTGNYKARVLRPGSREALGKFSVFFSKEEMKNRGIRSKQEIIGVKGHYSALIFREAKL
ncbi:hypothetical protein D3C77_405540 [compost metagenome]